MNALTIKQEANMTRRMSESIFSWQSLVSAAVPPRDPNDDNDEDDQDDDGEDDDHEPAVIREPDED